LKLLNEAKEWQLNKIIDNLCHPVQRFWTPTRPHYKPRKARFSFAHDPKQKKAKAAQIKACSEESSSATAANLESSTRFDRCWGKAFLALKRTGGKKLPGLQ